MAPMRDCPDLNPGARSIDCDPPAGRLACGASLPPSDRSGAGPSWLFALSAFGASYSSRPDEGASMARFEDSRKRAALLRWLNVRPKTLRNALRPGAQHVVV